MRSYDDDERTGVKIRLLVEEKFFWDREFQKSAARDILGETCVNRVALHSKTIESGEKLDGGFSLPINDGTLSSTL